MAEIFIKKLEGILKSVADSIDNGSKGNKNNKIDGKELSIFKKEAEKLKYRGRITESEYNSLFAKDNEESLGVNVDSFDKSNNYCLQDNTYITPKTSPIATTSTDDVQRPKKPKLKFDPDFELNLTKEQSDSIENIKKIFAENKDRYKAIEEETGVPAELVCAIHYREGGNNFGTYLHNGQKLGKRTTVVPKGKFFTNWEAAAVDAIKSNPYYKNVKVDDYDSQLEYAERYNGLGYRKNGHVSPYVYSGTDKYTGGKYVRDGRFNPKVVDKQVGIGPILYALYNA